MERDERPLIAVTTTTGPAGGHQLPSATLYLQYLAPIEAMGAAAVLITPGHGEESVRRLLRLCQGLMLTGGEDVDPVHYGQERLPVCGPPNPDRDQAEMLALSVARERGLPVLAICRGMQLLNVAMGGTLYQDLPSQMDGALRHEQEAALNRRWHHATVVRGSGLERIFGERELFINSFHHQGVHQLAPGLRATVRSEDGLIEAVEADDDTWLYGVQWHPERHEAHLAHDERDPDRRLFWAFVEAARQFALGGAGAAAPVT